MRFSVVLFDLDGTLIDTNHLIVDSFKYVLMQELRLQITTEELYTYFGEPLPMTLERWAPGRGEELAAKYRIHNVANHDRLIRQFEGMWDAVKALSDGGVRLGVVTSKKVQTARRGLKVCNMEHLFETVVGMDETERHKPAPEPALLALERLQVSAGGHVLMVGDSRFDLLCGKNAGLKTAAVGWTVQNRGSLSECSPDYWVEHPSGLVPLVLGN